MEASGRDGGGDPNCVTVRAPCIGLIPASANLAAAAEGPRGLVITLDSRLLETKSRQVFGTTTSQPRLWLQAWDPFLRETASTLTSALARRLDLGCLEAFADVIALHISCRYYHGGLASHRETSLTQRQLTSINRFISDHIAENIQVEDLARLLHMSPSNFARAFKETTGSPPHFHLTTERLTLAKFLLSSSRLPLVDVAASAGFQTQQHFTEVFHRYTGMTPRMFRLDARGAMHASERHAEGTMETRASSTTNEVAVLAGSSNSDAPTVLRRRNNERTA